MVNGKIECHDEEGLFSHPQSCTEFIICRKDAKTKIMAAHVIECPSVGQHGNPTAFDPVAGRCSEEAADLCR